MSTPDPPPPPPPGYGAPQPPPVFAPPGPVYFAPVVPPVLQGREFAGWGARFAAFLLDSIIELLLIITLVGWIIYPALAMARSGDKNGQTLGKQALGIQVVREDGREWSFGTALLREFAIKTMLIGWVGGWFVIPTLINYLWPLWDERKQALHDKLAESYVVKA
jgi:uncharacterized RDD family membrane protein YckC